MKQAKKNTNQTGTITKYLTVLKYLVCFALVLALFSLIILTVFDVLDKSYTVDNIVKNEQILSIDFDVDPQGPLSEDIISFIVQTTERTYVVNNHDYAIEFVSADESTLDVNVKIYEQPIKLVTVHDEKYATFYLDSDLLKETSHDYAKATKSSLIVKDEAQFDF